MQMNHLIKATNFLSENKRIYDVAVVIVITIVAIEVFASANPDRLDWIDWWFWARQNLEQLTDSGTLFGVVMSPVEGLFGPSCPINPYFHPLWAVAARINDPVVAHTVSASIVFLLYSVTIWVLANYFIQRKIITLIVLVVCINLFFDVIPITEIYPLPKSNFDYFQIVPPHTFCFLLGVIVFMICVSNKSALFKALANLGCLLIALLADPLHTMVFFPPILALVGIYYLFDLRRYTTEILLATIGIAILFVVGVAEYPLLLRDSLGRSVFHEYLFHHTKRTHSATFAFQNKQNLVFIALTTTLLVWHTISRRDRLSASVVVIQITFLVVGFWYLATDSNLDFLPNAMILESNVIPLYFIFSGRALEDLIATEGRKVQAPFFLLSSLMIATLLVGKLLTMDLVPLDKSEHFSQEKLLVSADSASDVYPGSTTFLLGTRGSQLSQQNGLVGPFSFKHVIFTQNNEHSSQFLGKYGRSAAIASYWLNGYPTLEQNSHMTNPFYIYFFRNLFTRDDDYYMTNLNFFTVPQTQLYPMLGVRKLISDIPTPGSKKFTLEDTSFFNTTFTNYNYGQYAPTNPIKVGSAREAISVMGDPLFDPKREYLVLEGDLSQDKPLGKSTGQINYDSNGIRFVGESEGITLHVLPVLFSNCLASEKGNTLVRVNLLLTGIMFNGKVSDKISYVGPPFRNDCLKEDIEDIQRFNLRDRAYAYPPDADKGIFPSLRHFLNWIDPINSW